MGSQNRIMVIPNEKEAGWLFVMKCLGKFFFSNVKASKNNREKVMGTDEKWNENITSQDLQMAVSSFPKCMSTFIGAVEE